MRTCLGFYICVKNKLTSYYFVPTMVNVFKKIYIAMPKQRRTQEETTYSPLSNKSETLHHPVGVDKSGNILITVEAKPGAKKNAVTGLSVDGVVVQISAPPVEGGANTELVKYIASVLGVKKNTVSLDKGSRSRHKVILVSNCPMSLEEVLTKIQNEIDQR